MSGKCRREDCDNEAADGWIYCSLRCQNLDIPEKKPIEVIPRAGERPSDEQGTVWRDEPPDWVTPQVGRIRRSPWEGRSIGQSTMSDEEYDRAQRAPREEGTETGELLDWGPTEVSKPPR